MKKLNVFIGLCMIPFFVILFILDRIVLVALVHVEAKTIGTFFSSRTYMKSSLYRVVTVFALIGLIKLIKTIIS